MRRPAPRSLADIVHPGPRSAIRRPFAFCQATPADIEVPSGTPLLGFLGTWADAFGFSSAVLDLGGLGLASFDYVMPDRAVDDRHVAWYSDTRSSSGTTLVDGVAVLGRRDGTWFAHIHAFWAGSDADHLGHLLPHTLTTSRASKIAGHGLKGARFEARHDRETEFTLFRVAEEPGASNSLSYNAMIATLAPFEDLHEGILELAMLLDDRDFDAYGLGSLAGAEFHDGAPMTGLVSEILLLSGAGRHKSGDVVLPVRCVDLDGNQFRGDILPNHAPTLVTCELLLRKPD